MASDSFYEEMQPRYFRPTISDAGYRHTPEVSEPSLFKENNDYFLPQKTAALETPLGQCFCSGCRCKTSSSSPLVLDDSFKELISQQNDELRKLREQIEKLLGYQENLQHKTRLYLNSRENLSDESTQTTLLETTPLKPNVANSGLHDKKCCHRDHQNVNHTKVTQDCTEITLTFRDLHLETIVEQPSSPQPSVCISMQDYPEFSKHLENESVSESCGSVMNQIQKLLSQTKHEQSADNKMELRVDNRTRIPAKKDFDTRRLTMQRLRELGISFIGNVAAPHNVEASTEFRNQHKLVRNETNESLQMQYLEQKYLGRELQATQDEQTTAAFSVCTQQYLQRYGLVDEGTKPIHSFKTPQGNPGKFLDSVLLRDQPKFL